MLAAPTVEDNLGVGRDPGELGVEDMHDLLEEWLDGRDVLDHHALPEGGVEVQVHEGRADLFALHLIENERNAQVT